MEREPDSLVDQHLDALYDKALREDAVPWNDAVHAIPDEDVSFPEDPCPASGLDWDDI